MLLSLCLSTAVQALSSAQGVETPRDAVIGTPLYVGELPSDDAVPRPIPARFEIGALADRELEPASGDPFFLGFAAGKFTPPADERIDPELAALASQVPADGRPAPRTYAFVMFQKRMTEARVRQLEALGARVIEFHPFYTLKVSFDPQRLNELAGLDFVRWIGCAKRWQKLHPDVPFVAAKHTNGELIEVYVNVFESDLCADSVTKTVAEAIESDPEGNIVRGNPEFDARETFAHGWQQAQLEALGLEVGAWIEPIRAFRAKVRPEQLEALVALDFVQFVDLDREPGLDHDEGMPMSNADRVRATYDGSLSGQCQVGIIDSGLDTGHAAIDPYGVGWDYSGAGNAFDDTNGHGTHTGGTILGNDDVDDSYQGGAPGLALDPWRRFFVVRKGSGASFSTWLSVMNSSYFDGTYSSPAPMVVSNSYSSNVVTTPFIGSESDPRTIDANAFVNDQLWIWSASNEGPTSGTLGEESVAKNALTVGNVVDYAASVGDPGTIWSGSSRGPCGDGRWKPNVSAVGQQLTSCQAGTTTGYVSYGGTSMSTPLVSSIAAQLCDHYSFLRYNPSALSAVLMAGTLSHGDQTIDSPSGDVTHLNSYGVGRVDSYKANFGTSQQALFFWSFNQSWSTGGIELDFAVNSGATRVTVVYHYKEAACSAGASQALINDVDMYLDAEPFTGSTSSGDYVAQQSAVDNSEVRMVNSPPVGNWKVKLWPDSIVPFQNTHAGVCVIVTYGDTTPTPTLNVTASDIYVNTGDPVTINATYTNPETFASGVFFDSSSSGDSLAASYNTLLDGSTTDLMGNLQSGRDVAMGNVIHNSSRTHHWTTSWASQGAKLFSVNARSDNAVDVTDSVTVYVDDTAPSLPTNLGSSTHTVNAWSNQANITYTWTSAIDTLSGVDGYGIFTSSAPGLPSATKDIEQVSSYSETLAQGSWYFMLRSVDNSGNWNASYANVGPFRIDLTDPSTPTGLASTTHSVGVQSCSTTVNVTWNASSDSGGSGLAGYAAVWSTSASTNPATPPNLPAGATSFSSVLSSLTLPRYFHIRAVDNAGNYGATAHFGPFFVNANSVASYCTGKTNSLGCVPAIGSSGQPSKSAGSFTVTCSNAISQKNGLLFWGLTSSTAPFQGGIKCVASPTVRTPTISSGGSAAGNDCSGTYSFNFSTSYMNTLGIDPGDTLFAQWWMRDPASASTTGLSNALQFTVCE
ncbi:MAG: S8 family serine peptidase [Planctomycetes bacterium]|nr:S8 family serine peptidase [Planctomycetota bacterium]